MKYRVYDTKEKCWITDSVYMAPNGELYEVKKSFFGSTKFVALDENRYVYHIDIDLYDKNNILVLEGDYIKAVVDMDNEDDERKTVIGVVAYVHELAGYVILCDETEEFYMLGSDVSEFIEVIGNVFDGINEDEQDGYESL